MNRWLLASLSFASLITFAAVGCDSPSGAPDDAACDFSSDACPSGVTDSGMAGDFGEVLDGSPPDLAEGDAKASFHLRAMAANLTSGPHQSYDPGEGIRIFQGLRPDLVLIQEFHYGEDTDEDLRAFVDQAFGPEFSYARESETSDSLPNGVVSRYPIMQSGEWHDSLSPNRDFVWAEIALPGGRRLWAVSLHLLTSSSVNRAAEAEALVQYIESDVPDDVYLLVGGDLNTSTDYPEDEGCITSLGEVVVVAAPWPTDQAGKVGTNALRKLHLDWLLADSSLHELAIPVEIGANTFASGLVFDSRVYTPLADVSPVQLNDSGASNMQHMGVVRDFYFP